MSYTNIELTRGLFAKVSPADAEKILQHKWHAVPARKTHYAATKIGKRTIYMHRLVLGLENVGKEVFVDHINFDGLDNQRENLRESDPKLNAQNRRDHPDYLGQRGVRKIWNRWEANIRVSGNLIYLGSFDTEREAGIAYSAACRVLGRSNL